MQSFGEVEKESDDVEGWNGSSKPVSHRVRLPLLGTELLVVVLVGGVVLSVLGVTQEGKDRAKAGRDAITGHSSLLESLLYSPDGQVLLSCGWDKMVKVWSVAEGRTEWGREIDTLPQDWHVFTLALTDDGKYLAAGGVGGLTVWSRPDASRPWEVHEERRDGSFRCVATARGSHMLAMGGCDGVVRFWDMDGRKEVAVLDYMGHQIRWMGFSSSGSYLAAATFGGQFRLWDVRDPKGPRKVLASLKDVQCFAFNPDDRSLAVARQEGARVDLVRLALPTGALDGRLAAGLPPVNTLTYSGDGRTLASASNDFAIRFWDARTGELETTMKDHLGWVKTMTFSPDGRRIAFGGEDGTIHFRDVTRKEGPQA